jgi:hypothetical protein
MVHVKKLLAVLMCLGLVIGMGSGIVGCDKGEKDKAKAAADKDKDKGTADKDKDTKDKDKDKK